MSVGQVFSKAFELWKKDVLWLVLAGLVIGVIIWVVALIAGLIVAGLAVGGVSLGVSGDGSISGLGAGALFGAVIVGIVAAFLVAVLGVTLQGGLYEMVIGAARDGRPVQFADLFSGFRRFGSYAVFALVIAGIMIGCGLLFVTLIGIPVAIALVIWIGIMWLYVLPLIADHGLTFGDAQRRSREMVKSVGWWRTFGQVVLLVVAIGIVDIIISAIFGGGGGDVGSAKYIVYQFITLIVSAIFSTYMVCYISVMYLGSGGAESVAAGAYGAAAPPAPAAYAVPPAPPAPPAPAATSQVPVTDVTAPAPSPATPAAAEPAAPVQSPPPAQPAEAAQPAAPEPPVAPPEAPVGPNNPPPPPPLA